MAACSPVYFWFARQRGLLLGLASIPLLTVFYLVSFAAGVAGLALHIGHRVSRAG